MLLSLELQVTARPVSSVPFWSKAWAVACDVSTAVIELADNATVTDATGAGVTVIADDPDLDSLAAVIVADPAVTAVTRPFTSTMATAVLSEDHAIARPLRVFPLPSLVTAVSWTVGVIPRTRSAVEGVSSTVATGAGVTVIWPVPLFPSLSAVIVAVPGATAVTSPVLDTVATAALSLVHVTGRFVSARPRESVRVAVACVVWIALIELDASDTVTVATGAAVTVTLALPVFPSLVAVM